MKDKMKRKSTLQSKSDSNQMLDSDNVYKSNIAMNYRNLETIMNSSSTSIVQQPFNGVFKEMDVMSNGTLFHKTKPRGTSCYSNNMYKVNSKRPFTGSSSRQYMMSQYSEHRGPSQTIQITDSSFASNFPFFSTFSMKEDQSRNDVYEKPGATRAKTPGLMGNSSQEFEN
jgi:hypothetical protein